MRQGQTRQSPLPRGAPGEPAVGKPAASHRSRAGEKSQASEDTGMSANWELPPSPPSATPVFLFRAKLITQCFYTSCRSAAEGGHPLQDTHQHWGWITRPPLVGAVPHRPTPRHRPAPRHRCRPTPASSPVQLEVTASQRLIWSKVHGTGLPQYHLLLFQYRCFRYKFSS